MPCNVLYVTSILSDTHPVKESHLRIARIPVTIVQCRCHRPDLTVLRAHGCMWVYGCMWVCWGYIYALSSSSAKKTSAALLLLRLDAYLYSLFCTILYIRAVIMTYVVTVHTFYCNLLSRLSPTHTHCCCCYIPTI